MKLNTFPHTHEGAKAKNITPEQQLRRSVMSCLLWENTFYENGVDIAERISSLIPMVDPVKTASLAKEARDKMNLRHVPLLLTREMSRNVPHKKFVAETLSHVIQRPDELTEFLAIYWKDGKTPLSNQVKKGLAGAFPKFSPYQLAKYNRPGVVKLRDVLFMTHPKPKDKDQEKTWKKLVDGTLPAPDTWEVALSRNDGLPKKYKWERLLMENKIGAMALIRNLRNFVNEGVDEDLIRALLNNMNAERVLPYRFCAAAIHAPRFEPELEAAMMKCLEGHEKLEGKTVVLLDVSGSMTWPLSEKSKMTRLDAACCLAILLREICEEVSIYTFSNELVECPPRHGFALRDAVCASQPFQGTYMGNSIKELFEHAPHHDRLIVLTDEQSHDNVPDPITDKSYMMNIATYQHGVGYGKWMHIDGWSDAVISYIIELEKTL